MKNSYTVMIENADNTFYTVEFSTACEALAAAKNAHSVMAIGYNGQHINIETLAAYAAAETTETTETTETYSVMIEDHNHIHATTYASAAAALAYVDYIMLNDTAIIAIAAHTAAGAMRINRNYLIARAN